MAKTQQEVEYRGVAQWLRRKPHLISREVVAKLEECEDLEPGQQLKALARILEISNSERTDWESLSNMVLDLECAIKSAHIIKETRCEVGSTILIGGVQAEVVRITSEYKVVAQIVIKPWEHTLHVSPAPLLTNVPLVPTDYVS